MDYRRAGRAVGIGVRVLGRVAGSRVDAPPGARNSAESVRSRPADAGAQIQRAREGGKRFGASFFGPLKRAGRSLILEIAAVFFALFAAGFLQNTWRLRAGLHGGESRSRLVVFALLSVVFLYFSVSSFLRARKAAR